jgi:hypothetical protein
MIEPRYLGDGVYASFDGFHIWLGLHAGEQLIALEPAVMAALSDFNLNIRQSLQKVNKQPAEE